jgi:hypothetical protein
MSHVEQFYAVDWEAVAKEERARADAAVQQARVNATLLMEAMDWLQDPSAYFGTDQADDFNKRVAKVLEK